MIANLRVERALKRLDALVEAHPELTEPCTQRRAAAWLEGTRMAARPSKGRTEQIMLRVTPELLRDRDQVLIPLVASEIPGADPTRSDAIRIILARSIEDAKRKESSGGPQP